MEIVHLPKQPATVHVCIPEAMNLRLDREYKALIAAQVALQVQAEHIVNEATEDLIIFRLDEHNGELVLALVL